MELAFSYTGSDTANPVFSIYQDIKMDQQQMRCGSCEFPSIPNGDLLESETVRNFEYQATFTVLGNGFFKIEIYEI